jgi:hypothetical protein
MENQGAPAWSAAGRTTSLTSAAQCCRLALDDKSPVT